METPDIAVVTKADMGADAIRARADVKGALSLSREAGDDAVPVMLLSSNKDEGVDGLIEKLDDRWVTLSASPDLDDQRRNGGLIWLRENIQENFGRKGLQKLKGKSTPINARSTSGRRLCLRKGPRAYIEIRIMASTRPTPSRIHMIFS